MVAAGVDYHKTVKATKGTDQSTLLGPPFLHVFKAMVQASYGVEAIGEQHRSVIKKFWDDVIMKQSLESVAEMIRHCRCRSTKKKEGSTEFVRVT
eukprot:4188701-Pyramimonas_sp.AAC.1